MWHVAGFCSSKQNWLDSMDLMASSDCFISTIAAIRTSVCHDVCCHHCHHCHGAWWCTEWKLFLTISYKMSRNFQSSSQCFYCIPVCIPKLCFLILPNGDRENLPVKNWSQAYYHWWQALPGIIGTCVMSTPKSSGICLQYAKTCIMESLNTPWIMLIPVIYDLQMKQLIL